MEQAEFTVGDFVCTVGLVMPKLSERDASYNEHYGRITAYIRRINHKKIFRIAFFKGQKHKQAQISEIFLRHMTGPEALAWADRIPRQRKPKTASVPSDDESADLPF